MLDGVKLKLGENELIVPPLTLKSLRKLAPKLKGLSGVDLSDGVSAIDHLDILSEIVHAALVRNYPQMKLEDVEDILDTANMAGALAAVLAGSGFDKVANPGEASGS